MSTATALDLEHKALKSHKAALGLPCGECGSEDVSLSRHMMEWINGHYVATDMLDVSCQGCMNEWVVRL